jgi:hypothetical protein
LWLTAELHYHAALTLAEHLSDYNTQAMLLTRAGLHYLNIGDADATLKVAEKSRKVLGNYNGSVEFRHLTHYQILKELGKSEAEEALEKA